MVNRTERRGAAQGASPCTSRAGGHARWEAEGRGLPLTHWRPLPIRSSAPGVPSEPNVSPNSQINMRSTLRHRGLPWQRREAGDDRSSWRKGAIRGRPVDTASGSRPQGERWTRGWAACGDPIPTPLHRPPRPAAFPSLGRLAGLPHDGVPWSRGGLSLVLPPDPALPPALLLYLLQRVIRSPPAMRPCVWAGGGGRCTSLRCLGRGAG